MLVPRNKDITVTGTNIQVQIPTTITQNGVTVRCGDVFVYSVTFEAATTNSQPVFIGCATGTGASPSAPSTLVVTNSLAMLLAGQAYTVTIDHQNSALGELIALSRYYVNGTASDKILISYEERVLNG